MKSTMLAGFAGLLMVAAACASAAGFPVTTRISQTAAGAGGDNGSDYSSLSADARYVAFSSAAANLVADDTNGTGDVFVLDRQTGEIVRVSVSSTGEQANGYSGGYDGGPAISADGRYVVFKSEATNLVPGDTNLRPDIFVHDRITRTTRRVSVSSEGVQGNSGSSYPTISADGRWVAFTSAASNFMGDYSDNNLSQDIFVHDLHASQTFRVSVRTDGSPASGVDPAISADGRYVAFLCWEKLVPEDTNGVADVYVRDRLLGTTTLASKGLDGLVGNDEAQYGIAISGDGRFVAFNTYASNLVAGDGLATMDTFVVDRLTGRNELVNVDETGVGQSCSYYVYSKLALSADGRHVSFTTDAPLSLADTNGMLDLYVRDRWAGQTHLASLGADGAPGGRPSYDGTSLSANGRYVTFRSMATNLISGDSNDAEDVFVRDLGPREVTVTVTAADALAAEGGSDAAVFEFSRGMTNPYPLRIYFTVGGTAENGGDYPMVTNQVDIPAGAERVQLAIPPAADQAVEADETITVVLSAPPTNQPYYALGQPYVATAVIQGQALAEVVSLATNGAWGGNYSECPVISADGRYVVFRSAATNLVANDSNGRVDVFLYDRQTRGIERVSLANDGSQASRDSGTGGASSSRGGVAVSADGRYVAFQSTASNLATNDTNTRSDVFVRDRQAATTRLISAAADGSVGDSSSAWPMLSGDGRYVAFLSSAANLVTNDFNNVQDLFVYDTVSGAMEVASVSTTGEPVAMAVDRAAMTPDGRYLAFSTASANLGYADTNNVGDVFVRDRQSNVTELISCTPSGEAGSGYSSYPAISADGRYVAFCSAATNLVANDTNKAYDVFVRDRLLQATTRISVASDGHQALAFSNGTSYTYPQISADGRYVAFSSKATDLVPGDDNGSRDIFLHDRQNQTTRRVSVTSAGAETSNNSENLALSGDGRYLAFQSVAADIVRGDTNLTDDIFLIKLGEQVVASTFDAWLAAVFPANEPATNLLALADPDGDGIPNVVEYAFAMDPRASNRVGLPCPLVMTNASTAELGLNYRRPKDLPGDVVYLLSASPSLVPWTNQVPATVQEVDQGGYTAVTVRIPATNQAGFLRLIIQQKP